MNRKFLLLIEEEYPNPCEPVLYPGKLLIHMDLGEVVEIPSGFRFNHTVSA
jgi:hypothetical protein